MIDIEDSGVGVYKILLLSFPKNRILYVGQSKYLSHRFRTHRQLLKSDKHHNPYLQNIYNKHGLAGIKFEIICTCRVAELDTLEQFYIDELKPECNIVRDVKKFHEQFVFRDEPAMLDINLPGLELDWVPKPWHVWVYGCGRHGI